MLSWTDIQESKMASNIGNSKAFRSEKDICAIPTTIRIFWGAYNPTDVCPTQYEDQRQEIKYGGLFPVCGFRVGFLDVGRNLALQYIVSLD